MGSVLPGRLLTPPPRRMDEEQPKWVLRNQDIISGLPDDILLQILSRVDTKTAVATGVLSRRWKHLHALLPCFHLSLVTKTSHRGGHHLKLNRKLSAFLNTFYAFADPDTHPNMMSLVVEFDYYKYGYEYFLKRCIEVALTGGKLQHLGVLNAGEHYVFPALCSSDGLGDHLQSLAISNCILTKPHILCAFRSLRKLILCRLSFSGKSEMHMGQHTFQVLLKGCSSLEILSVEYSTVFPLLIIDGPNQLKELTINHCKTDGIKIAHAPKLEKLECFVKCAYFGSERCTLEVSTVPCLKHFRLGFDFYPYRGKSGYTLEMLAKAAPNLETLVLCFENTVWIGRKYCNASFLNLRHLVLVEAQTWEICSSFWIGFFLKSAPFLESLEIDIKMEHYWDSRRPPPVSPHSNLKVLKLKGFGEESTELEMSVIQFVLASTTSLERVVISRDTSHGKKWLMAEKNKILKRIGGGTNSNPLIIFT